MKYAYEIIGRDYIHEYILNDDETAPEGTYVTTERIDCTNHAVGPDGTPIMFTTASSDSVENDTMTYGNNA